jgi:hypothetical protein
VTSEVGFESVLIPSGTAALAPTRRHCEVDVGDGSPAGDTNQERQGDWTYPGSWITAPSSSMPS